MNRRRQVVVAIGSALAANASPLGAQTSAGSIRRVGVIGIGTRQDALQVMKPLQDELARLGWVEGRSVVYDVAAANWQSAAVPRVAAELVARYPHVILVGNPVTARAAKQATSTIPIVFFGITTPVEEGIVASLAHPGGNVTGVSPSIERFLPKRIQLLRDLMPRLRRVGIFRPPVDPVLDKNLAELEPALSQLGVTIVSADVADAAGIEPAVARLVGERVDAIMDATTAYVVMRNIARVIELTGRARVPFVANVGVGADAGALFGHGGSAAEGFYVLARLTDRVLRGASPADIPVEAVNAHDLVVNVRVARQFGITVPQSVLLRATRVIE